MLELANVDPGLDKRSACSADAVIGSTDTVMLIVLGSDGTGATPGPWPVSIDPNTPPVTGPCGVGLYASFSLNGLPYFAFLGIGAGASDADRQSLFDAYAGMQARTTAPTAAMIGPLGAVGYVLAAGTEQGVPWRLELGPSIANPATPAQNMATAACLRVFVGDGLGSIGCTPFPNSGSSGPSGPGAQVVGDRLFVDGAVLPDATAVEYRAAGQDPVAATILTVPDSVRSSIASLSGGGDIPARLYWVLVDRIAGRRRHRRCWCSSRPTAPNSRASPSS